VSVASKEPILETVYKKTVGKRVAHNTGLMVGSKFLGVLMGAATLFITEWALDDQISFGSILFLHAYMLFFAEVATFHSWQSIIRFGSEDIEQKNATRLSKLINFSLKIDGLSAILGVLRLFNKFDGLAIAVLVMPALRLIGAIFAATQGWGIIGFLCVWWFASVAAYLFRIGWRQIDRASYLP